MAKKTEPTRKPPARETQPTSAKPASAKPAEPVKAKAPKTVGPKAQETEGQKPKAAAKPKSAPAKNTATRPKKVEATPKTVEAAQKKPEAAGKKARVAAKTGKPAAAANVAPPTPALQAEAQAAAAPPPVASLTPARGKKDNQAAAGPPALKTTIKQVARRVSRKVSGTVPKPVLVEGSRRVRAGVPAVQQAIALPHLQPVGAESAKFALQSFYGEAEASEFHEPVPARELPAQYGLSRLVIMLRDPQWLYAYWEFAREDQRLHRLGEPQGAPPLLLRLFQFDKLSRASEGTNYFDTTVPSSAREWFVHLPHVDRSWRAEIGFIGSRGEFVSICKSNALISPRHEVGEWSEESQWQPPNAQAGEEIYLISAGVDAERVPALAATRIEAHRRSAEPAGTAIARGGASEAFPGPREAREFSAAGLLTEQAVPGSALVGRAPASEAFAGEKRVRGFHLWAKAELIVYGGAEPDASLTIGGRPIRLRPDGTFSIRMELPDGLHGFPIRARSADGVDELAISITVTKKTE